MRYNNVMVKDFKIFVIAFASMLSMMGCSDDDNFTLSPSHLLTFSLDTVKMDTLFSNVPSATKSFWVYNKSGDGIRCSSISLEQGSNSGFRVNVDGIYLGESSNWQTNEVEIRNKDSVRVFVEVTLPRTNALDPKLTEDNLVFTLESGAQQKVNLNAWAWDATQLRDVVISKDSTISSDGHPIVIYGGIRVDSTATLTITQGTTLYFHADAGIDVYGRLVCEGAAESNVTLRGDRIDYMFDYLPYDRVPAQWIGIRLHDSSYENEITFTDIHSTNTGIEIDSSGTQRQKLRLSHSTIHNCQGYGLATSNAKVSILNSQLSNTLYNCILINGGDVEINGCTIAQFYPFDGNRGSALGFNDAMPLSRLSVLNTLITGYADDEMSGAITDSTTTNWLFDHCMIRTPAITTIDSLHFTNVIYEDVKDTVSMGTKHFIRVDANNQAYDFRLDSISCAIGKADPATVMTDDRNGLRRDDSPDIGAYEYQKP